MKKIIFGFPILILIVAFIIRIVSADAVSTEDHSSFFDPIEEHKSITLHYTGFTVSYNPETRQPDWVSYILTAEQVEQTKHMPKIPRYFMPDPNLDLPQATNEDYKNSGWVRGHMARRQDMKWSEQAVRESDYFTNICSQDEVMNNGVWHQIENLVRRIAVQYDSVHVICGPIFTDTLNGYIGPNQIPVPDYFFKTLLIKDNYGYHTIAFLCPNNKSSQTMLEVVCTVNKVESISKIDVYSYLPNDLEEKVESDLDIVIWKIL